MNASKHGTIALPGYRGASKSLFQERSSYTAWAMAAIVNLLNIISDAPGRMFEQWTPPSMVSLHFFSVEELAKVCSKSVRRTQPELHTRLLLQYTSAMAAIVNLLNIISDAHGRMFERWKPPSMTPFPGWRGACKNLFQVCSSYTAWTTHPLASLAY